MFTNSGPHCDGDVTATALTHLPTQTYSWTNLLRHYIQDHFVDGRQIAKNRHIATPTTSQMRDLLEMIPVKYEKNRIRTVACERF